ncbi:MAG TPA: lamin tail domain-containing protein [Sedimentisphaerales bacterium]|jgi:hypothetical protein|nr:lamin tail domain-containing protein [Sedimentisphaerales bacterium]HNU27913.1 lamin tail domain-containing protein [Sedimentisphaerales bacterium]
MHFGRRRNSILLWASLVACVCLFSIAGATLAGSPVVVNEVMASNVTSYADPQGEYDDWIELYNTTDAPIDAGGLYLTDDQSEPRKWQIPTGDPALTTIPAQGFLLIWADGDTGDPGLHADFGLGADGDEVALFDSDGRTLLDSISFGPQISDFSYGRNPDGGDVLIRMALPTPSESNIGIVLKVVAQPQFSQPRGFQDGPFTLELTTATEGAIIYYTLDGKRPLDAGSRGLLGTQYTGPITIFTTTCVRAAAVKTGWLSSATVTHSYIFLNQVIRQSSAPAGFPTSWGGRTADYAMDQRVVEDAAYRDEILDDLKSTPSVSIVIPNSEFFESGGIYASPGATGDASERAASIEWIDPSTGEHFGVNAGLRIHGGPYSRSGNPKNAFRVNFRAQYGLSRLEFPLFPDTDVTSFNSLALRSIWNYSWSGDSGGMAQRADYLRDAFARDTVRDMGRLTPYGRPIQVYINGLYWGLYIMTERPNASFAADHLGGDEDDYEILEAPSGYGASTTMDIVAGDERVRTAWTALFAAADKDVTSTQGYEAVQAYIDIPTMIDYMLMIYYTGSRDAPVFLGDSYTPRNFYAIRHGDPASPFTLVPWDTEWALEDPSINRVNVVGVVNPHYLMDRLAANADFRILLADRIYEQFYNDGALTKERTTNRYLARADEIRGAIVGESARWGDEPRPSKPYTREDWQTEVNRLVNQYFSGRTQTVLRQLQSRGWYPSIEAPIFQIDGVDRHGGYAVTGASLIMAKSASGAIWYTLDGSDPRVPGSEGTSTDLTLVAENAAKRVTIPTAALDNAWRGGTDFDDSAWLTGAGGVGYERSFGYEDFFTINVQAPMYSKNTSCYIRIPFSLADDDLQKTSSLSLSVRYDDGFVAYLNGAEVARANFTGEPAWNSKASASHPDSEAEILQMFSISEHIDKLKTGGNILAIHGLNESTSGSDFLISVELTATSGDTGDSVTPGGTSLTAIRYTDPLTLNATVQIKARVLSGAVWSALHETVFAVGPVAESLRISEIMYHPSDTGNPDDPNTEFIELTNVSEETINLSRVRFTNGIEFAFPSVEVAPGGYCLVVKDVAAFEARYSSGLPVAGQYAGSLSNAGERIELQDALGKVIHSFRYEDDWYKITDGTGYSLTVIDPSTADPSDFGDSNLWLPSKEPGGSPGTGE